VKEGRFAAAIVQLASAVIPAGLSEDEEARQALQASTTPSIPTPLPTPATAAPPTAPVINMDMSEPDWPLEIPMLADLNQLPDDDE
jgi:hypothetical protein